MGSLLGSTTVDRSLRRRSGDSTFPSMEFATDDHSSHLGAAPVTSALGMARSAASATAAADGDQTHACSSDVGGDRATPEERRIRLRKRQHPCRGAERASSQRGLARSHASATTWTTCADRAFIVTAEQQRRDWNRSAAHARRHPESWEEHVTPCST